MAKITGIGGTFLRAKDPKALAAWYRDHLGVPYAHGFAKFVWADIKDPQAQSIWTVFPEDTDYFGPGTQQVMINYRVDDLTGLLAKLDADGIKAEGTHSDDNGKFAWIVDPEGNRIELWEPASKN